MSIDLAFALEFADRAGHTVRDLVAQGFDVDTKADLTPITTVDRVLNEQFVDEVARRFPGDAVIGEEASLAVDGADRTWVIDPIDGTRQLILGVPLFMVSIALVVAGRPVVAVALNPSTRELYQATLGGGAFRDGRRLSVSNRKGTVDAPATVGGTGAVRATGGLNTDGLALLTTDSVEPHPFPFPSVFSGCKVAEGTWDADLYNGGAPWDVAAVALLVTEAGGTVTDRVGAEQRYDGRVNGCLLSNGAIHDRLAESWIATYLPKL